MWPLSADLDLRHTVGTYAAQSGASAFLESPAPSVYVHRPLGFPSLKCSCGGAGASADIGATIVQALRSGGSPQPGPIFAKGSLLIWLDPDYFSNSERRVCLRNFKEVGRKRHQIATAGRR